MTSYSPAIVLAVVIELAIALVIVRRSYLMSQGVSYSVARLVIAPVLLVFLWVLSELESLLLTPWALPYLIALDVVILVLASLQFARVAERVTRVFEAGPGEWRYQIGFSITVVFLVAFLVRLGLAVALFPDSLLFGSPPGGFPASEQQAVVATIDAIFSLSVGLLIGRAFGIHRKWRRVRAEARRAP